MAFIPASNTVIWKNIISTGFLPTNVSLTDSSLFLYTIYNPQITGVPAWMQVSNLYFKKDNPQKITFQVQILESVVNTLLSGTYTAALSIKFKGSLKTYGTYNVSITVIDTVLLKLTPSTLTYNWTIGTALPQNQTLQIATEANWLVESITQTWITTNISSGFSNSQLVVSVDPTGLAVGTYTGQIYVRDSNDFLKYVDVYLTVLGVDTDLDYLYVSPSNMEFVSEFEVENTKEISLNLEASGSWTASPSAAWIVVSETSGITGIFDLVVSVDSAALSVGAYQGSIIFINGDIIKTIYVSLKVIEFFIEGVTNDTLYFVDDRNKLSLSSTTDNTYLQLDTVAATGLDNIPYSIEAPYLKGVATLLIGQETNNLMPLVVPTTNFTTRIQNNITPVNIRFNAYNINRGTDAALLVAQYQNLLFLKGKTPLVANKLCYVPEEITVTNKAVLSLTVLSTIAPEEISFSTDEDYNVFSSIANGLYVYNAIVNLSMIPLVKGDTVTINFGNIQVLVNIKANEPEENLLAFENEWGEMEFLQTTGFLTKTPTITDTTTEVAIEGKEHTKIVRIDHGVAYTLNTGFIYSQEEIDWLAYLLKAKRKFFYENGEFIEIILTTKDLEVYATREHTKSYNLKFKRAII